MERLEKRAELSDTDTLSLELLKLKIQLQRLKTRFESIPDEVRDQKIKEVENGIVELELQRIQRM